MSSYCPEGQSRPRSQSGARQTARSRAAASKNSTFASISVDDRRFFSKSHDADGVFAARDPQEGAREPKLAATELKNRLPWQEMNGVAKRLRAPQ